jgi:hypothetical protein
MACNPWLSSAITIRQALVNPLRETWLAALLLQG